MDIRCKNLFFGKFHELETESFWTTDDLIVFVKISELDRYHFPVDQLMNKPRNYFLIDSINSIKKNGPSSTYDFNHSVFLEACILGSFCYFYFNPQPHESLGINMYVKLQPSRLKRNEFYGLLFMIREIEETYIVFSFANYVTINNTLFSYEDYPCSFFVEKIGFAMINAICFFNTIDKVMQKIDVTYLISLDPKFHELDNTRLFKQNTMVTSKIIKIADYLYLIECHYHTTTSYLREERFNSSGIFDFIKMEWKESSYDVEKIDNK